MRQSHLARCAMTCRRFWIVPRMHVKTRMALRPQPRSMRDIVPLLRTAGCVSALALLSACAGHAPPMTATQEAATYLQRAKPVQAYTPPGPQRGDRDLDVVEDVSSTQWLLDLVGQAAAKFGDQSYFFQSREAVGDDHTPFVQRGVPCADLIDFDYGYQNAFWHTPQDTMDKLSAKSLTIVGDVFLETIQLVNQR